MDNKVLHTLAPVDLTVYLGAVVFHRGILEICEGFFFLFVYHNDKDVL